MPRTILVHGHLICLAIFINMMELSIKNNEANIVDAYWEQLRSLSIKAKLRLATMLTTSVLEEESQEVEVKPAKRVAKIIRRAKNAPSDAELQARFEGLDMPNQPKDPEWSQVIDANIGKTIKPIEKWL